MSAQRWVLVSFRSGMAEKRQHEHTFKQKEMNCCAASARF
jgi:hypothetical protein